MLPATVYFEVFDPTPDARIEVGVTWLGEERTLVLTDDGSTPGDAPGDGVRVGSTAGDAVRLLPVRVRVDGAQVWDGLEPLVLGENRVAFTIERSPAPWARRVVTAASSQAGEANRMAGRAAALGWMALVLGFVAWLARPRA